MHNVLLFLNDLKIKRFPSQFRTHDLTTKIAALTPTVRDIFYLNGTPLASYGTSLPYLIGIIHFCFLSLLALLTT
jgi:hypothetical protein